MEQYLSGPEYRAACERYRGRVVERAAALAQEVRSTGRRLRVGHFVMETTQYPPSLARAFHRARERVDYQVFHGSPDDEGIAGIRRSGVEVFRIEKGDARSRFDNWDVLFIQHPYYSIGDVSIDFYGIMGRLSEHILPGDADRDPLLAFFPYAFTAIDEGMHRPVDGFHDLPVHNIGWRVYCETKWHLKRAKAKATLGGWNWRVTGYPKLDEIVEQTAAGRDATADSTTIIWAPHHNRHLQTVPIPEMHEYFARLMDELEEIRIIFRPHPNLLQPSFDPSRIEMTRSALDEIVAFWSKRPRAEIDMGAGLGQLFARSDLMVTDCGGFQAEYFVTGRPLISYIRPAAVNSFMERKLRAGNYPARSVDQIDDVIRQLVQRRDDPKRRSRARAIKGLLPRGDAGEAIVRDLVDYFC